MKKFTERPNAVSNEQEANSGILVLGNAERRNEYRHVIMLCILAVLCKFKGV